MNTISIADFEYRILSAAEGVDISVAFAGTGPAVVLLHGFPQTHYMWRDVASRLAERHTVIVPDLRGYGQSSKPAATGPDTYSKRAMAQDIVQAANLLGSIGSGSSGTTGVHWSGSVPAWIIPRQSSTSGSLMSSPPSTPGRYCTGSTPQWRGTCISWPNQSGYRKE